MRHRRWMAAALALVMIFENGSVRTGFAEEFVPEGEEVFFDEFEEDPEAEWAEDVGNDNEEEQDPEYSEYEDQEDADFLELIEENGMDVVTVSEGGDYQEIRESESESESKTDAAAGKVRELMNGIPLLLESADPERIRTYLKELSAEPSPIGSDGELETAAYIEKMMSTFGYTISEQHFHEGFLNEDYRDMPGVNIIAERGADSEERTNDIILICAHYDSKTKPAENDPLANDKSSAAALLECARILSVEETNVDLCFLFLSGEEDGYYGSLRLAEDLTEEIRNRIKCVIYVGSVGYRMEERTQIRELLSEAEAVPGQTAFMEEEAASEQQTADTEDANAHDTESKDVPPLLIAAPTDQSNDPANLLRALGLYRKAEELLTEGFSDGDQETGGMAQEAAPAAADRPKGVIGEALSEAAGETIPAMSYEGMEEDWTLVTGDIGFLQNFTGNGMIAAGLFQPVSEQFMQEAHVRPLREDNTVPEADRGGVTGAGSVSDSPAAENVSDILLAAGSVKAGSEEQEEKPEEPQIIPVQDDKELAAFADYLASAVSLYMRSRTSIVL